MSAQPQEVTNDQSGWIDAVDMPEERRKSRRHYLFVGIDDTAGARRNQDGYVPGGGISCQKDELYTGVRYIKRGRFTLVRNKNYVDPRAPLGEDDNQTDMIVDPGSFSVGRKVYRNFAKDIAVMLVQAHLRPNPGKGLRVIDALTDAFPAVADWIQHVLLSPVYGVGVLERLAWLRKFDASQIPDVPDDPNWRGFLITSRVNMKDLVAQVQDECIQSCVIGESYVRTFYSESIAEMKQTAVTREGLSYVSDKLRQFAQELGLATPDDLADQIARSQTGPAQVVFPPEFWEMMKRMAPGGVVNPNDYAEFEQFLEFKRQNAITAAAARVTEAPADQAADGWTEPETVAVAEDAPHEALGEETEVGKTLEEKAAEEEGFEPPKKKKK